MTNRAFWQQGEVQVGRVLPDPFALPESWAQSVLAPPPVLEVRLRIGLIPADSHLRWQLEVLDPQTHELLAMNSHPHAPLEDLDEQMARIGERLGRLLYDYLNPDPFP